MDKKHRTYNESAELFKKYQMTVHNDPPEECGPNQFYHFLVSTPLKVFFYSALCMIIIAVFSVKIVIFGLGNIGLKT